jgi:hypothetical protein
VSTGTSLTKVTVGVPHASDAVTKEISASGTVALQPKTISAGQLIDGGVLSAVQVTVRVAVAELPQPSEAIKVLTCVNEQPEELTAPSVNVTIGVLHAAVAVAEPSAALISEAEGLQPRVTKVGVTIIVGGLGALNQVTVLLAVAVLPQSSTAVKVLVCEVLQVVVDKAPSVKDIVGKPHASVAVAVPSAASISEAAGLQPRVVVVPVAVIDGGVTSTVLVISCAQVAVLPQASIAL